MSKLVKMVPVYYRGESRRAPARDFVGNDGASELVATGLAEWSKNGKSLILTKTRGQIKLRDLSCTMGYEFMEALVMAPSSRLSGILAAWTPRAMA